ncbi:MAG: T9SS type A sorting domain-containing protein [Ignavibacteriaceae bacterium]|nr:T9SS type A sorting domain-containing protein [Ignavibacteriaceae bacterium]
MKKFILTVFALVSFFSIANAQWVEQTSGVTITLYSVSAVDDNVAWVAGAGGAVLRTTDGGATWTNVTGAPIPVSLDLYNIYGVDANTALVTGSGSTAFVYRTTDGGNTWTEVFSQPGGFLNVIKMLDANNGFMEGDPVGGRWSLFKTNDGGATWDSTGMYLAQNGGEAGWNNSGFVSGTNVYFGTSGGRVYFSSTSGTNFTAQSTGNEVNSYSVWFNDANNGLAGGTGLVKTTNGGASWAPLPAPGTAGITGIIGSGNNWWVARQDANILYSNDNGASWTTQYSAPGGVFTSISKSRSGNSAWAVRSAGGISKNANLVGVINISSELPEGFLLSQNYPNPFNPATTINFSIPENSFVKLRVFDMLGREVDVLVNEELNAGTYAFDFNATALNSGIYFYSLEAGSFKDTRKMILVK